MKGYFLLYYVLSLMAASEASSSSILECKKCIDKDNIWCPSDDDYSEGQCFATTNNRDGYANINKYFDRKTGKYTHPGLQLRQQCSDKVDKVSNKYRRTLKYWACPYQEYCGDRQIIVPPYSSVKPFRLEYVQGKSKTGPYNKRKKFTFGSNSLCRHHVKFPLDSQYGDKIRI